MSKPKTTHIIQGSFVVSSDPNEMLVTILGSCVSACLYDPNIRIGGMNHFLLGHDPSENSQDLKYGIHSMELLINELLKHGANRKKICAKLFGGAQMRSIGFGIGQKNIEFAVGFLQNEGIELMGQSLGGTSARRIRFWPTNGRSQQLLVEKSVDVIDGNDLREHPVSKFSSGTIELF